MIEPGDCLVHRLDRRSLRLCGSAQHDDANPERARRGDLAIGRGAAAVLGDDDIDGVLPQQLALIRFGERTASVM